ncbi:hypothetical protein BDA99DRAFT_501081 [Phascolomyces articulosus]|uniref:Transmembrane protein n=1 Tax=Phascolomyces articulosus TaxID=60185 RepID=A0AAD5PIT8_9FUNG|nr:hypothetical protein BDA99DRAFT_501081 [Phascolomyces articulosus]
MEGKREREKKTIKKKTICMRDVSGVVRLVEGGGGGVYVLLLANQVWYFDHLIKHANNFSIWAFHVKLVGCIFFCLLL